VPTIEIDRRFSEPGSEATPWSDTEHALGAAELFWITTVRPDGRPHVSPIVAVWLGGTLHFSTGGTEQKAANLRRNHHVVLTTGCNTWDKGLDVVVEGDAVPVTDEARLAELAREWRGKWDGRWEYEARDGAFHHPGGGGVALVYAVHPAKVIAFGKGGFTQTSYRF
jgi:hypothetical protein